MRREVELFGIGPLENGRSGYDPARSKLLMQRKSPEGFDPSHTKFATDLFETGAIKMPEGPGDEIVVDLSLIYQDRLKTIALDGIILRALEATGGEAFLAASSDRSIEHLTRRLVGRAGYRIVSAGFKAEEGPLEEKPAKSPVEGEKVVILSTAIRSGNKEIRMARDLESRDFSVSDIVALVDFETGALDSIEANGYKLTRAYTARELLVFGLRTQEISPIQYERALRTLTATK